MVLTMLGFEGVGVGTFVVCGAVGSVGGIDDVSRDAVIPDGAGTVGGDELRVRRVDERRAFNCIT